MYPQAAEIGDSVDSTFFFIVGLSVILLLGITATMIYFVIRYNHKRHQKAVQVDTKPWLEATWIAIPTLLVLAMFYSGYEGFVLMRNPPAGALEIRVTARMWDWSFEYANGKKTKKLFVPVGKPIKLLMTSLDVIHSFYLPAFRVKEDVLPGRQTYLWFKPESTGPADIFCAEFCGQRHSYMMAQVVVMKENDFQNWYGGSGGEKSLPAEAATLALFDKHGCMRCHTFSGGVGGLVPLRGLLGPKKVLVDGKELEIQADEAYLRRAITSPHKEIVKGFVGEMQPPENLSEAELDQMVNYLKTL